jgi:hypothetical protein
MVASAGKLAVRAKQGLVYQVRLLGRAACDPGPVNADFDSVPHVLFAEAVLGEETIEVLPRPYRLVGGVKRARSCHAPIVPSGDRSVTEAVGHPVVPRSGLLPTGGAVGDGLAGGEDAEDMPALAV